MLQIAQVYYKFWSSFKLDGESIPAFARNQVPKSQQFPYITYEIVEPNTLESGQQSVIVWTMPKNKSSLQMLKIMEQIKAAIDVTGKRLLTPDGRGMIMLRRGNPFAQIYEQEQDDIKASYINIEIKSYIY